MKNSFDIAELIVKKIKGIISETEQSALDCWINESPDNLLVYEKAVNNQEQLKKLEIYKSFNSEKTWGKTQQRDL